MSLVSLEADLDTRPDWHPWKLRRKKWIEIAISYDKVLPNCIFWAHVSVKKGRCLSFCNTWKVRPHFCLRWAFKSRWQYEAFWQFSAWISLDQLRSMASWFLKIIQVLRVPLCTSGCLPPSAPSPVATRHYFDDCQVLVVDMGQNRVPEEVWFTGWRITPLSSWVTNHSCIPCINCITWGTYKLLRFLTSY